MRINITKQEYITLLEILEIADWVLHAHKTQETEDRQKYRDFEQKIFTLAKEFGCDRFILYDKKLKRFFPTQEFEEASPGMSFIEEFTNEAFWDELIDRLSNRDLVRELGENKYKSLDPMDRFLKVGHYEEKYGKEFEVNGLERIELVAQQQSGTNPDKEAR